MESIAHKDNDNDDQEEETKIEASQTCITMETIAKSLVRCYKQTLCSYSIYVRIEGQDEAVYFGSSDLVDFYTQDNLKRKIKETKLPFEAPVEEVVSMATGDNGDTDIDIIKKFVETVSEASQDQAEKFKDNGIKHETEARISTATQTGEDEDTPTPDEIETVKSSVVSEHVRKTRKPQMVMKLKKKEKTGPIRKFRSKGRPRTASLHPCSECDYMAPSFSKLTAHMNKHRPIDAYKCVACDKIFKYERLLFMHYERNHQFEMMHAEMSKGLTTEEGGPDDQTKLLLQAKQRAESARPHECSACHKRFKTAIYLTCHFQNKHGPNAKTAKQFENGVTDATPTLTHADVSEENKEHSEIQENKKTTSEGNKDSGDKIDDTTTGSPGRERGDESDEAVDNDSDGEEDEHICGECGMVFSNSERLQTHRKKHTVGKIMKAALKDQLTGSRIPIFCPHCNLACDRPSRLKRHILEKHDRVNSFNCEQCGKGFRRKYHLERHQETHTPEKERARAERTPGVTSAYTSLNTGRQKRALSGSILCEQCGFISKSPANLRLHVKKMHLMEGDLPKKLFMCTECEHISKSSGDASRHRLKHTNEKPFTCEFCGQRFKSKYHMKRHQNVVHQQGVIKRYPCPRCQLTFTRLEHLRRHQSTHQTEKPYNCRWCSQTFARMEYVKVHERRHTGEKPYCCQICNRGFYDASSLRKHEKGAHINTRMNICQKCGKKFVDANRLLQHQIKFHGDSSAAEDVAARSILVSPPPNFNMDPHISPKSLLYVSQMATNSTVHFISDGSTAETVQMNHEQSTETQPPTQSQTPGNHRETAHGHQATSHQDGHANLRTPTHLQLHQGDMRIQMDKEHIHNHSHGHSHSQAMQPQAQTRSLETIDSQAIQTDVDQSRAIPITGLSPMCVICGQTFGTPELLLMHMRVNHEDNFPRELYTTEPHPLPVQPQTTCTSHQAVMMYPHPQGVGIQETPTSVNSVINALQSGTMYLHNPHQ